MQSIVSLLFFLASSAINFSLSQSPLLHESFTIKETVLFSYTGHVQTYIVPSKVSVLYVEACGASGASTSHDRTDDGNDRNIYGGNGGCIICNIDVSYNNNTSSQTLYVYVGNAFYNGGGKAGETGGVGGGASDIRLGGQDLTNRIVVGGGGGGYGAGRGGDGGGTTACLGSTYYSNSYSRGIAMGGSQTCGGQGGYYSNEHGSSGSLGDGGDGSVVPGGSGGGGGGGYYGGFIIIMILINIVIVL
jgi:hypothetical protein